MNTYKIDNINERLEEHFCFKVVNNKNIQIKTIFPSLIDTKILDIINKKIAKVSEYYFPHTRYNIFEDIITIFKLFVSKELDGLNSLNIQISGSSVFQC